MVNRGFDSDEHPLVRNRIKVNNGSVMAMAGCQDVLVERLDELVLMVLEYALHSGAGKSIQFADMTISQN